MARPQSLLEETLEAWTFTRDGVISELENIPADLFTFRPSDKSRTVTELAQHIIESGLLASGELTRPDGSFRRQPYPQFLKEHAGIRAERAKDKQPLITLARQTLEEGLAAFRKCGDIGMLQTIVQFNGEPATRLTWMNHAISHEEYHRGQLALYARLMGRTPALTQLIEGSS
jgi:uncharacterized damage-inducible protein DinB